MRKAIVLAIAGIAAVGAMAGVASAQTMTPPSTGDYPSVASLHAFSAGANFMSLPGYLRYLVYQQHSQWLTRPEAARIVRQQGGF